VTMWEDDYSAELENHVPMDTASFEDLGLDFASLDPEPSDETEALYRRVVLGERFLGDG